jgi:hypothetical protein
MNPLREAFMKRIPLRPVAVLAIAWTAVAVFALLAQEPAKSDKPIEEFAGYAVPWSGGPQRIEMDVFRWTTEEERAVLRKALQEGGTEGLLQAIRKTAAGYVRFTNTLRYTLNFAFATETDKGRIIKMVTERPIAIGEELSGSRSLDYLFGVIEFTLNEKGKGEGTITGTAKISLDEKGEIKIETVSTKPNKLMNVSKLK